MNKKTKSANIKPRNDENNELFFILLLTSAKKYVILFQQVGILQEKEKGMARGKQILGLPKGKHLFGTVKVGEKGQIVIPKEARELFGVEAHQKAKQLLPVYNRLRFPRMRYMYRFV